MIELTPTDITELDIFSVPYDLRRDLHVFVQYIREREAKRLVRSNDLSKADYRRLAKLVSDPEAVDEVKANGRSSWVAHVDWKALKLGFVSYDTEGVYLGYTSRQPSYPDNYVIFNAREYQEFLDSPLIVQERRLLDLLIGEEDGCRSEFFHGGYFGRLGSFKSWGCATGVIPMLDFPRARRFLLDILRQCEVGVWYRTSSLVQYLKEHHPYFLIPEETPPYKLGWREKKRFRYGNFYEGESRWKSDETIPDDAPDGFERVEGRYVERFLEGAPLTLGYVDVAYTSTGLSTSSSKPYEGIYPPIDHLRAFRVTNRLVRTMEGDIPAPKVTVQPNFEIYVESEFYPAKVLSPLAPLADVVSEGILTILKLDKEKVAAELACDEDLDVVALLNRLTDQELPRNVVRELKEWSEHAEKFTLYAGFALLEGDEDLLASDPLINEMTVERISPNIRLVRSPDALFDHLEEAELAPLRVKHTAPSLYPMPQKARTVFAKKSPVAKPKPKRRERVNLMRSMTITLHFPNRDFFEKFRQSLLDAKCPVKTGQDDLTLTFSRPYEDLVAGVLKALGKEYRIHIEDV